MGDLFKNIEIAISVLLVVVPIVIAIWLVIKLVVPRNPTLGWGLVAAGGLLGGYLVRRRLKKFSDIERKLAQHNEEMARFKEMQSGRFEAVTANLEIVRTLKAKRKALAKDADKHKAQIAVLDEEIKAREARNEELVKHAESFVERSEERSRDRLALLDRMAVEPQPLGDPHEVRPASQEETRIEVDGFSLVGG